MMPTTLQGNTVWPTDTRAGGSPVLRPAVVQPAGPTGEAEQGVEGTLHAVESTLCRPTDTQWASVTPKREAGPGHTPQETQEPPGANSREPGWEPAGRMNEGMKC